MRYLLILILLTLNNNLLSQNIVKKLPEYRMTEEPTLIINDALSSYSVLQNIKPKKIKKLEVLRPEEIKTLNLDSIPVSSQHGIIKMTLKKAIKTISKSELNLKQRFPADNDMYFDGFLIEYKDINICTYVMNEIEVVKANDRNGLKTDVINIWTLPKSERFNTPISRGCSLSKMF